MRYNPNCTVVKMTNKRRVEVFSAGCALCHEVINAVRQEAGSSCEVIVRNMMDSRVLRRAEELGIRSVPAVVIDGKLASSTDIQVLRAAGLGKAP